jgi:DNA-binding helix-hairpin-helix protein with protein kinase domain
MLRLRSSKNGTAVTLAGEIARGGEGAIYSIQENANSVAKIYLRQPDPIKAQKIAGMSSVGTDVLTKISAWPTEVVSDDRGQVRGFLMPKISSRSDVHQLYSPKSRASVFPEADFRFIVHVAANAARAFGTVHSAGHVIGDINHGHLLVGMDGRAVLIDADSFQVSINGRLFTCDVGAPLFTPPELQGKTFRGLVRTQNHDLFGLAVVLFHLLFMGRHPYAGVWRGAGDMPIEKAISEYRFAYGANAGRLNMSRPPGTVPLGTFGPAIGELFERAFSTEGNVARPSAVEWVSALDALGKSLRACPRTQAHHYPNALQSCPWCEVEKTTGVRLFGFKLATPWVGSTDISSLWAAIERAPRPSADPALPSQQTWTKPLGTAIPSRSRKLARQAGAIVLAGLGLVGCSSMNGTDGTIPIALFLYVAAYFVWPRLPDAKRRELEQRIATAKQQWDQLQTRWVREASVQAFDDKKRSLLNAKKAIEDIPNERQRRLAKLRSEQQEFQRRRFLDRFRIDRAKISGIGDSRAAILASFGIETAYDVVQRRILAIRGFGPTLTNELISWRQTQEAKFRFNPNEPIDPGEISRVEGEIAGLRNNLMQELRKGASELARLCQEIPAARARLLPALNRAWDEVKLAELHRRAS